MRNRIPQTVLDEIKDVADSLSGKEQPDPRYVSSVFTFQGRKSITDARDVINLLSKDREEYLDPFFGTGSFLVSASMNNKKVTGIELDNYTFFEVKLLLSRVNEEKLINLFSCLEKRIKHEIMGLYRTSCTCGQKGLYIKKLYFDPGTKEYKNPIHHREIRDGNNIIFCSPCVKCGNRGKNFDDEDAIVLEEIEKKDTKDFPNHCFITNSRINITEKTGANRYGRNFTNRAKLALLIIQKAILELPSCIERDLLESVLVSSISLSKICMYGSSTDNLYHVIIEKAQETNVWSVFEKKFKEVLKYKKDINDSNGVIVDGEKLRIINSDFYDELQKKEYLNRFDVIYTDPPYTDQVPYLEKNQYFRDWLSCFYDKSFALSDYALNKEMVITNAPSRRNKSSMDQYLSDVDKMFSIFWKVNKVNGLVILTLKLAQKSYFSVLTNYINLARKNGFEYIRKVLVSSKDPTIRKQAAFANTVLDQYLVFFVKLDSKDRYWYIDNNNMDQFVIKETYSIVKDTICDDISNIVNKIANIIRTKYGYFCNQSDILKISNIIKKNFKVDDKTCKVYLDVDNLYIGVESHNELFIKLLDYIPPIVKKLLELKDSFVLDDLYAELGSIVCDGNDTELFNLLIQNNAAENKQIRSYLNMYCDEENGAYVKKKNSIKDDGNRKDLVAMNPYEFESFITSFLLKLNYDNATRVGGAGDRGIDIQAKNVRGNTTIFQCKRWLGNVGGEPIQRLHSQMVLNTNVDEAICITTSHFTEQGKQEAKATGVKLIDGSELIITIERYYPGKYWNSAVK